jgi:outer membrane protein insertion porin family
MKKLFLFALILCTLSASSQTQIGGEVYDFNYTKPKEYIVAGIVISGIKFLDQTVLMNLSGLSVGDTIAVPGDKISKAIDNLWKQGLFSDVKIIAQKNC